MRLSEYMCSLAFGRAFVKITCVSPSPGSGLEVEIDGSTEEDDYLAEEALNLRILHAAHCCVPRCTRWLCE